MLSTGSVATPKKRKTEIVGFSNLVKMGEGKSIRNPDLPDSAYSDWDASKPQVQQNPMSAR